MTPTPVTATIRQQPKQTLTDVTVHLVELNRRVARAEVAAPTAQDGIEDPDHVTDVLQPRPTPPVREVADFGTKRLHGLG